MKSPLVISSLTEMEGPGRVVAEDKDNVVRLTLW